MRVHYVKYIKDTGEIRQWGDCAADSPILEPGFTDGPLLILAGVGTNAGHYVRLSDLAIIEKAERPSQYHVFNYSSKEWVMSGVLAWDGIREQRNKLLAACDWTVLPDVSLSIAQGTAWAAYRQALRDIPAQSYPLDVVWPTPPN